MDNGIVFAQRCKVVSTEEKKVKNAFLNIYYVESGGCKVSFGKREYIVLHGYAVAVRSKNAFTIDFEENTIYMYAALQIEEAHIKNKNYINVIYDGYYGVISDELSLAVKKFEYCANGRTGNSEGLALEIYSDLAIKQPEISNLSLEMIEVFRKKAWDENFNLEEYLHSLPYAYDYLRRAFKKETGKTPLAFVTDLRLSFAASKLRCGKADVKELSKQVGIRDPLYFSRLFKKKFGISPLGYVKRFKE